MPSAVLLLDDHSIVRWCNHAFSQKAAQYGLECVGKPAIELFANSPLPAPSKRVEVSLAGKEPLNAHLLRLGVSEFALILTELRAPSFRPAISQTPVSDQGGRILVVDDEPGILRAFTRALSRQHEVVTASDGVEAKDLLLHENFDFDVIITDVSMIKMGGVELYRWIERENPNVTGRVFFMTGGVFDYDVESFLQSGPIRHRVLRKPFDPEVLQRMINERLRR
jgi:CheY-like chemotaxis protein